MEKWGHVSMVCAVHALEAPASVTDLIATLQQLHAQLLRSVPDCGLKRTSLAALRLSLLSLLTDDELGAYIALDSNSRQEELRLARKYFPLTGYYPDPADKAEALWHHAHANSHSHSHSHSPLSLQLLLPFLCLPEQCLSLGGDDRVSLALPSLRNKYHTTTMPCLGTGSGSARSSLHRGSCTCSALGPGLYLEAHRTHFATLLSLLESARGGTDNVEAVAEAEGAVAACLDGQFTSLRVRVEAALLPSRAPRHTLLLPSGTDAEYIALLAAAARAVRLCQDRVRGQKQSMNQGSRDVSSNPLPPSAGLRVLSIVTCGGEVGSGTLAAAGGRHFAPFTPLCPLLRTGEGPGQGPAPSPLDDIRRWTAAAAGTAAGAAFQVETMQVGARDAEGRAASDTRDLIEAILKRMNGPGVAEGTAEGHAHPDSPACTVALLHLVHSSKTGLVWPPEEAVRTLEVALGERLVVVIDCCQMRTHGGALRRYLDGHATNSSSSSCCGGGTDWIVLTTGSKFFGGPPFSGACSLGERARADIEALSSAYSFAVGTDASIDSKGLSLFLTAQQAPPSMPALRALLSPSRPDPRCNSGLLLRWTCALRLAEDYNRTVSIVGRGAVRAVVSGWAAGVRGRVEEHGPCLQCLLVESPTAGGESESEINSIVTLLLHTGSPQGGCPVTMDEARSIHRALATGVAASSSGSSSSGSDSVSGSGGQDVCMYIGQPVAVGALVAVRLALSASAISGAIDRALAELSATSALSPPSEGLVVAAAVAALLEQDVVILGALARATVAVGGLATGEQGQEIGVSQSSAGGGYDDAELRSRLLAIDAALGVPRTSPSSAAQRYWTPPTCRTAEDVARILSSLPALVEGPVGPGSGSGSGGSSGNAGLCLPHSSILYDMDRFRDNIDRLVRAFSTSVPNAHTHTHAHTNPTVPATTSPPPLHCLAIKSAPLPYLLHTAVSAGLGLEAASWPECLHALRLGCPARRVVFDSPCKTDSEVEAALRAGVCVNVNSLAELGKVAAAWGRLCGQGAGVSSVVGLRVNPLVGPGSIAALSTATRESKFGLAFQPPSSPSSASSSSSVGVDDSAASTDDVVELFRAHPFLCALHVHVGSQGMSLASMVRGVAAVVALADAIDAALPEAPPPSASQAGSGPGRVRVIDIGGGLPVDYSHSYLDVDGTNSTNSTNSSSSSSGGSGSAETGPDRFAEYAALLRAACPSLLGGRRCVVTEFGKALVAECAVVVARIEDVIVHRPAAGAEGRESAEGGPAEKEGGGACCSVVVHAGADLFPRTAYCPQTFAHRIGLVHASSGRVCFPRPSSSSSLSSSTSSASSPPVLRLRVVGPLCFSGDTLGELLLPTSLPTPTPMPLHHAPQSAAGGDACIPRGMCAAFLPRAGDFVCLLDAGANTLSLFSRHCSRPSPAVWAYRRGRAGAADTRDAAADGCPGGPWEVGLEGLVWECLRREETVEEVLRFWG